MTKMGIQTSEKEQWVELLFIQPSKAISPSLVIRNFPEEGDVMAMELPGMLYSR